MQKEAELHRLQEENESLRNELTKSQEKIRSSELGAEDTFKSRLERQKNLLLMDQDQDRGAYQRLLKEYHELEQRYEIMEQKLAVCAPGHTRSLSNASSGSGDKPMQDDSNTVSI